MRTALALSLALCTGLLAACGGDLPPGDVDADGFGSASPATLRAQEATGVALPPDDGTDLAEAERGLVAREESLRITAADGRVLYDQDGYRFIEGVAPVALAPGTAQQPARPVRGGARDLAGARL